MLTQQQIDRLYLECKKLCDTSVIEEEAHVFGKPLLIAMSTVLSLNRKWYSHALPARTRFEKGQYAYLSEQPLEEFVKLARDIVDDTDNWKILSNALWKNNEWQKARLLTQLAEYLSGWCKQFHPNESESVALKNWAASVRKEEFLPLIKGLGPRAYEQLLWYIEGVNSIKFDRHIANFLKNLLDQTISDTDGISALKAVAKKMGISATNLDARIWDYMQTQANA